MGPLEPDVGRGRRGALLLHDPQAGQGLLGSRRPGRYQNPNSPPRLRPSTIRPTAAAVMAAINTAALATSSASPRSALYSSSSARASRSIDELNISAASTPPMQRMSRHQSM